MGQLGCISARVETIGEPEQNLRVSAVKIEINPGLC
jgi:hypothetical protein